MTNNSPVGDTVTVHGVVRAFAKSYKSVFMKIIQRNVTLNDDKVYDHSNNDNINYLNYYQYHYSSYYLQELNL